MNYHFSQQMKLRRVISSKTILTTEKRIRHIYICLRNFINKNEMRKITYKSL